MDKIKTPWTDDEVECLKRWQSCPLIHKFTCRADNCRQELVPTNDGWVCPECGRKQDWAHPFMFMREDDEIWKKSQEYLTKKDDTDDNQD
jgi:rRNA maturation protein Nop10